MERLDIEELIGCEMTFDELDKMIEDYTQIQGRVVKIMEMVHSIKCGILAKHCLNHTL